MPSEILYEDKGFTEQKLAALVASKVYYHLGAFNDSVHYALCAGNLFDVNDRSEYVETIIGNTCLQCRTILFSYRKLSMVLNSLFCLQLNVSTYTFKINAKNSKNRMKMLK